MLTRWLQRKSVHAIHKRDLDSILKDLGLFNKILESSLFCSICNKLITLENLQCIFMEENKIKFCCNNFDCYECVISKRGFTNNE